MTDKAELRAEVGRRIGREIARRRRALGMTAKQLAEESKISPAYVSKLEKAQSVPTIAVLTRIAKALKTDISNFLETEELDRKLLTYLADSNLGQFSLEEILELSPDTKRDLLITLEYLAEH